MSKIFVLDEHQYWTHYLKPLTNHERFSTVYAKSQLGTPVWDPNLHSNLVTAGPSRRHDIFNAGRLLVKMQHSPGFSLTAFANVYIWMKSKPNARYMLYRMAYDTIVSTKFKSLRMRDVASSMKSNPNVYCIDYDPKLHFMYNHPSVSKRQTGTVLISCGWMFYCTESNLQILRDALTFLQSCGLQITVLYHPLVIRRFKSAKRSVVTKMNAIMSEFKVNLKADLNQDQLLHLYDSTEYIVTDGSGSVYEAIVRGCKAVWMADMEHHFESDWGTLPYSREHRLLPDVPLHDILRHPGNDYDMKLVRRIYDKSLTSDDILPGMVSAILSVFDS